MTLQEAVKQAVNAFMLEGGQGSGRYPVGSGTHPDEHAKWPEGVKGGGDASKYHTAAMEAIEAERKADSPGLAKTKKLKYRKEAAEAHRRAALEAPNEVPAVWNRHVETSDQHLRKAQEHELAIGNNKAQKRFARSIGKLDRIMSNR